MALAATIQVPSSVPTPESVAPAAVWMLRRLNPGIEVCIVTRDINPVRDEEFLDQGAVAVLHRPFSLSQLTDFLSLLFPFNPSLSPAA